jgi:hypothetical protein
MRQSLGCYLPLGVSLHLSCAPTNTTKAHTFENGTDNLTFHIPGISTMESTAHLWQPSLHDRATTSNNADGLTGPFAAATDCRSPLDLFNLFNFSKELCCFCAKTVPTTGRPERDFRLSYQP